MTAGGLSPNHLCSADELATLEEAFADAFGGPLAATLVSSAPGRVNLIGEHTDYNGGFVLPIAIDRAIHVAARPRDDLLVRAASRDQRAASQFSLEALERDPSQPWVNYLRGVAQELLLAGIPLRGLDLAVGGDVPVGAGVSSSAAIELATAQAFLTACGASLPLTELALLCQRAENRFVGVGCGIMDQFVSALGRRSMAMLLDCQDLHYEMVPLPAEAAFVVCDTRKTRALGDSAYNERRAQCETGAAALGVPSLRQATMAALEAARGALSEVVWRRCRHVVTEIARTLEGADALKAGNLEAFGRLMDASHASLRDDYEVSCSELDAMVGAARRAPGCLGARLTGAGFGGCAVALVEPQQIAAFVAQTAEEYRSATNLEPSLYQVCAGDGVTVGTPISTG